MYRLPKPVLALILLLLLTIAPVSGQLLSDRTGLVYRLDVEAGGHEFEVETVSNFDIQDYYFDWDQKRLTLHVFSDLEENLGEVIIPRDLLGGDITVHVNDLQLPQKVKSNDRISFVTLNFTGSGNNTIDIFGSADIETIEAKPEHTSENGGGCLIATAAYGTQLAPNVQLMREIRDDKIMDTKSGAAFMHWFNQLYYAFSPTLADYQRENPAFNGMVRIVLTPLVASLGIMSTADSEYEVLVYGSAVILMNMGMYIAAPAVTLFIGFRMATR